MFEDFLFIQKINDLSWSPEERVNTKEEKLSGS